MLHSICQQIWKMQQCHRTGKGQFSFQSQRKAMPKNAQTTTQLHSSHMLVMLKILQARLQQYMNRELPDVQAGFRKGRGTRDQIANIRWIMEKGREFQKNIYFRVCQGTSWVAARVWRTLWKFQLLDMISLETPQRKWASSHLEINMHIPGLYPRDADSVGVVHNNMHF